MRSFGFGTNFGHPFGSVLEHIQSESNLSVDDSSHGLTSVEVVLVDDLLLDVRPSIMTLGSSTPHLTQVHILDVNNAVHGLTSEENPIIYDIALSVDNASHDLESDEVDVVTFTVLKIPHSSLMSTHSDRVRLIAHNTLAPHNASHSNTSLLERIIDWSKYDVFFGNYAERKPETGRFE